MPSQRQCSDRHGPARRAAAAAARAQAQASAAATDVEQANTLRETARAELAAVRLRRAQLAHAIAVLIGEPPSSLQLLPITSR